MKKGPVLLILTIILTMIGQACRNKGEASEPLPPNIILIMADDMGYECLGAYGSLSYQTPRLDEMAAQGLLATHCISNPLCTPSRVKIMTGKHNYRNYEYFGYLNPDQYTFGNLMREAGYATCIAGKWQLNGIYHDPQGNQDLDRPYGFGFDEYCLWQVHKGKKAGERFADPLIVQNGKELPRDKDAYGPDIFADYVCDFIERKRDSAFFIYYPMVLVHDPFVPTPDSEEWPEADRRYENDTAYFKDMVAYADKIVGRILDKLEETGISEHTLVIFTGDNGTHRSIVSRMPQRKIKGGKGMTIDAGVHVPLVIQWPEKLKEPVVHDAVIEFSDFFATFAALTKQQKATDGKSFLGLLEGSDYQQREFAFVHYDPMWGEWVNQYRNQFVQNKRYKLYRGGQLYDLEEDVMEKTPLEGMETLRREMQNILDSVPEMSFERADPL